MGEMASFWGYLENHEMEQKLLYTTLELEKLKAESMAEMRKNKQYINQLIHMLKYAVRERDEARIQFQKLLNKTMMPLTTAVDNLPCIPLLQSDGPLLKAANSSITESNSISEVDSLFDAVSSPEFSNINFAVNQPIDRETLVIDSLAKGKVLPEKGKLLQAVLQSGPLLQTLLVAGPLPRWRNPPQFQAFQIPPVSIKGVENAPTLNFANSGNCLNNASLMNNTTSFVPLAKRQRFC